MLISCYTIFHSTFVNVGNFSGQLVILSPLFWL